MRVSSAADTLAILVAIVELTVANPADVATGSPANVILVAATVVALTVPALTVVANKSPVRRLLTLTS
jgi:hypothetical protein